MKKIQIIIGKIVNILIVLVIIAIIVCTYSVFSMKVLHNKYVNFFGYSVFEVATGSMEDTINVGDAVLVKINDYFKVDDIITYQSGEDFITHRVVSINDNAIITKGDANNVNDNPIDRNMVLGKVVKILPNVGVWKKVVLTPKVIVLVLVTLFVFSVLFSYEGSAIKIVASKKAQKEIDQKIEDEVNKEVNKKVAIMNRKKKRVRKVLDATQIIDINEINQAKRESLEEKPKETKEEKKIEKVKDSPKKVKIEETQVLDLGEIKSLKKDNIEKTQVLDLDDIKSLKKDNIEKTQVLDLDDIKTLKKDVEKTQVLDLDDIKSLKKDNVEKTQVLDLDDINDFHKESSSKEMLEATQFLDISDIKKE